MLKPRLSSFLLALCLAMTAGARAHDPGLSTAILKLRPGKVEAVLTFAMRDAEILAGINDGGSAGADQIASSINQAFLRRLIAQDFELELDGRATGLARVASQIDGHGNINIVCEVDCDRFSSLAVESRLLKRLPLGHRQYLAAQFGEGKPFAEHLLSATADSVNLAGLCAMGPEPSPTSFKGFLKLGVRHILTGYDHILFLLGLLMVTKQFVPALRIITCFTLAHSITLALATFSAVPAPPRLVEPLIAASIVYVGIENLARGGEPKGRWLLTFTFGLIHGCGFASALRGLGIGGRTHGIAVPLVSFNLGVELGQLMIAALVLPVIWKLRTRPVFVRRFVPVGSGLVVLLGGFWLLQRLWAS